MLAVDDSLSMSENRRDRAALEAMVLLARAMSRLEVGDIGVVGFGGCVKTLHPLGEPFADQNGPKLVSKLTFRQDSTLTDRPMVTLLESLHRQLSLARESSSSRGSSLSLSLSLSSNSSSSSLSDNSTRKKPYRK